jgi:hypothetical protein
MRPVIRLTVALAVSLAGVALWAQPAAANSVVTQVIHVDDTFVNSDTCAFDLTLHVSGTFRQADYYDNSGFLYKTLLTAGGGAFTVTVTAKGTTLTMQNQSYLLTITYNADGSVSTSMLSGPNFIFTLPGSGIVYLDAGTVTFDSEGNIVFEGGMHQDLNGDVDAFCAAFG